MKDSDSPRDAAAPLGARHDDSSLFSLESLKKAEEDGKKQARNREDSGLIDLKALALMEREEPKPGEVVVAAVVAPADLFAIGPVATPMNAMGGPIIAPLTAPPITTAASPVAEELAKPNRTKLIVGVGAVIAIAAGAAVFMTSRAPTADAAAPAVTAAPNTPPAATAPPPPSEEPKAAAVNPGERPSAATADAKPTAAPVAVTAPKNAGGAPRPPVAKAAPKEDAPPPPKPADACDLACQMQRAVSGKK